MFLVGYETNYVDDRSFLIDFLTANLHREFGGHVQRLTLRTPSKPIDRFDNELMHLSFVPEMSREE